MNSARKKIPVSHGHVRVTPSSNGINIVLIGMRGSGKSTIAKLLSKHLGKKYIEMDAEVVRKTGMSIVDIFEKYGPEYFRDKESEVIGELICGRNDLVVATGGGVVLRPRNVERLKANAIFIWLQASVEVLVERTESDPRTAKHRPPLTDKETPLEETAELLQHREPLYRQAADEVVDTGNRKPQDVVAEILRELQKRGI